MAKIVVVDDNRANREFLSFLLSYCGYKVFAATNGVEGLEGTLRERPDLVISDILMPKMDGYQLARQIRGTPEIAATPIVFYTAAYNGPEAESLARACGVNLFLLKPSEPDVLLEMVRSAIAAPSQNSLSPEKQLEDRHVQLLSDKLSRQVAELEAVNVRLAALIEFGQALAAEIRPLRLLERLCETARDIIGARYAACLLHNARKGQESLYFKGSAGAHWMNPGTLMTDEGILAKLMSHGGPWRVAKLSAEELSTSIPGGMEDSGSFLGAAIACGDSVVGALCLYGKVGNDEFTEQDEMLIRTLTAQTALAYSNLGRYSDSRKQAEILKEEVLRREDSEKRFQKLAARLEHIREEERTGIARELHDELGQALTAIKFEVLRFPGVPPEQVSSKISSIVEVVDSTIQTVQRISSELRPSVLDLGLAAAIDWQVAEFQKRTGIICEVTSGQVGELHSKCATALFRVLQEALTNVARHSGASRVEIVFQEQDDLAALVVNDNGRGIPADRITANASMGIMGMSERITLLGGEFGIGRSPGGGTSVRASVPRSPVLESETGVVRKGTTPTNKSPSKKSRQATGGR